MKKALILILGLIIAFSCSDDLVTSDAPEGNQTKSDVFVENGRLVFRDIESFRATVTDLNKLNIEGVTEWRSHFNFKSLADRLNDLDNEGNVMSVDDEEYSMFPIGHQNVLNSKAEVKIGNEIFWYNKGSKYHAASEKALADIKLNPSLRDANTLTYSVAIENEVSDNTNARNVLPSLIHGGTYFNTQDEVIFQTTSTDNKWRRYTHKLVSFLDDYSSSYDVSLYFLAQMRYKNPSGSWVSSDHARKVYWNFDVTLSSEDAYHQCASGPYTFHYESNSGNIAQTLYYIYIYSEHWSCPRNPNVGYYSIDLDGMVKQVIITPGGGETHPWENHWYN